ncbi:MAG: tRNA (adenosine(37)-N6)-threonylcarbamoyltransferase complex dimerization subunit type 1 TsaB [Defluviitaleaceae bacterium]|nr:tRNA (adenosine(37)-N6)-threonylcarbamoyltransferase complex dimerization subunit type 1 TsaB [Defluviitaleaceae bacterium]
MKILAIDTSGQHASAAIVNEYITIGEMALNARTGEKMWTHSEILMTGIDQLFKLTRLEPEAIDYIAYTCGPGSFTGLRIGASTALGMAKALNIKTIPVPTLDGLAYNTAYMGGAALIVPLLDARRGQVYGAVYMRDLIKGHIGHGSEPMAMAIEDFIQYLYTHCQSSTLDDGLNLFFIGDGATANTNELLKAFPRAFIAPLHNNHVRAASVGLCALEKIKKGHDFSDPVDMIYVRAPQAVREKAKQQ